MDIVTLTSIQISWITPVLIKSLRYEFTVLNDLKKNPFTLGQNSYVSKFKSRELKYTINSVETSKNRYSINGDGIVICMSKLTKESFEIKERLVFRTLLTTKIYTKGGWFNFFGFDVVDDKVMSDLTSEEKSVICLYGPSGCGKNSFVRMLELREPGYEFIRVNLLYCDTDYTKKIINKIKQSVRNIVLFITNADFGKCNDQSVSIFCGFIEELLENKDVKLKVIVTCSDLKLLHTHLLQMLTTEIFVSILNNKDKSDFFKQVLTEESKIERNEEGLDTFAKSLRGYSARDIKGFVSHVRLYYPELTLDQLKHAKKSKKFEPEHLKQMVADIESLNWSDIGGYDNVKKEMQDLIQSPILSGKPIVKGVMLYGPPGCSKTMFARALATECDMNLYTVIPSNILCSYLGDSEAKLREILTLAKASAPSIVFFDEIDILIPEREAGNDNQVSNGLLSELLSFMCGAETRKDDNVIIMAATNVINNVDEALIRNGRMDLVIKIDLPDQTSRESILNIIFNDKKFVVSDEVRENIPRIAEKLSGKSGAEIVHIGKTIKRLLEDVEDDIVPTITMDQVSKCVSM